MSESDSDVQQALGLHLPQPTSAALAKVTSAFESFFNEMSKHSDTMGRFFDRHGVANDASDAPWYNFSQEWQIDGVIVRLSVILGTAIARANAAKAFVDENVLRFYLSEKNELKNRIEKLQGERALSDNELSLLHYIAKRSLISRLASLE